MRRPVLRRLRDEAGGMRRHRGWVRHAMMWSSELKYLPAAAVAGVAARDLTQRQHAILRNFPGTGYFGCRDGKGRFDLARLRKRCESAPVRAIEVRLSQGAKPGLGGLLPGAKVTTEIAEIRGIPVGEDCVSPSRHAEFSDVDSMLDWIELIAAETGLPVGIKSAVGDLTFWEALVAHMATGERGVDFVTVDGGEGGTGAAPLIFSDSVDLPFPALVEADDIEILFAQRESVPLRKLVGYEPGWGGLGLALTEELLALMGDGQPESAPPSEHAQG